MMLPPLIARVRVAGAHGRWPTLWLPLFLVWPLLFALLLVFGLPCVLLLCVVAPRSIGAVIAVVGAAYALLCELRGTLVDVTGNGSAAVFIAIS